MLTMFSLLGVGICFDYISRLIDVTRFKTQSKDPVGRRAALSLGKPDNLRFGGCYGILPQ